MVAATRRGHRDALAVINHDNATPVERQTAGEVAEIYATTLRVTRETRRVLLRKAPELPHVTKSWEE